MQLILGFRVLCHLQVRTSLNAIEALQQSKVKKMHKLELVQVTAGIRHPHTPYELYLLQNGKKLDLHCLAIAIAKAIEEETQACHEHEALFWQWMESVAREELLRPSTLHCHNLTGVTEVELFPALEDLKQLLTSSKQKN